jgi:hypothetical protein
MKFTDRKAFVAALQSGKIAGVILMARRKRYKRRAYCFGRDKICGK